MQRESKAIKMSRALLRSLTGGWWLGLIVLGLSSVPAQAQTRAFAYLTEREADSVSVIDTVTQNVIRRIRVGSHPLDLALTPDRTRVYVANSGGPGPGSVSVINTATDSVMDTIGVGVNGSFSVTIKPDGTSAYVTTRPSGSLFREVSVIDTDPTSPTFHTVTATIATGHANDVAFHPGGAFAYVTNLTLNTISVIDTDPSSPWFHTVLGTIPLDGDPAHVTFAPNGTFAYVTNRYEPFLDAKIWVIDTATFAVVGQINLEAVNNIGKVSFSPDGTAAFVTFLNFSEVGSIVVTSTGVLKINAMSHTWVDSRAFIPPSPLPSGEFPVAVDVAVTPDGGRAYVTVHYSRSSTTLTPELVWVVDTTTLDEVARIPVGIGRSPGAIAIGELDLALRPPPARAYVTSGGDSIKVIDTGTHTVVATITVGVLPVGIAITPDGAFAYVTRQNPGSMDGEVLVIDTTPSSPTYNTVVATIPVGIDPVGVAFTPDGNFAYVANSFSVSVINTATRAVVATILLPLSGPRNVAITPNGAFAYVVNRANGIIAVINTATHAVVATFVLGGTPLDVAIADTPNGVFAYVTLWSDGFVAVIDTQSHTVAERVRVGNQPWGVAVTPDQGFAYIADGFPAGLSVIDTRTHVRVDAVGILTLPISVEDVAITPGGTLAYVTQTCCDNSVTVINTVTNTLVASVPGVPVSRGIAMTP